MSGVSGARPRTGWIVFAVFLSVVAVAIELTTQLCASTFFDPLPNVGSILAYLSLPVLLVLNAWVMSISEPTAQHVIRDARGRFRPRTDLRVILGLALVGTSCGLGIAAVYTVLFIPVMPVGALAVIAYGLGFCAFSPVINLYLLISQFRRMLDRWRGMNSGNMWKLGLTAGFATTVTFLALIGHPIAIGYLYQRALTVSPRESSLWWLRSLGGESAVLDLCYQGRTPVWIGLGRGLLGHRETSWGFRGGSEGAQNELVEARRIYFLLTGRPYETAGGSLRTSRRAAWDDWEPVSNEQGGELVGHAIRGLSLASSRIDGVLDPKTETAYCEWTMVFENKSAAPEEARAELLLPTGGVVDKVSLWINGEERQAAFGARSAVRKAYQEVAVVQQRDPLLVTAKRPDRVMAQCFPVPANGKMKVRIGMSAPLLWEEDGAPVLCLGTPGFQQVNFEIPPTLRHELWMEGKWDDQYGRLAGKGWSISEPAIRKAGVRTARRQLRAEQILHPPVLHLEGGRLPQSGDHLSAEFHRERSPLAPPRIAVDLTVVLDTSRGMDGALGDEAWKQMRRGVMQLPSGSRLRLVDGRQLVGESHPVCTGWTDAKNVPSLEGWWKAREFAGGTDPAFALQWAVSEALSTRNPGAVLWLHGAVPGELVDASALTQIYERRPDGPALLGVQLRPGPDSMLDELAGSARVFSMADREGEPTVAAAIRFAANAASTIRNPKARPLGGREPALNGVYLTDQKERNHAASRLATQSEILARWYSGSSTPLELASVQKLAIRRRLVTPLSGAVVLETKEQYAQHQLSDAASDASIPSVPEPGTLALLAAAGMMGMGRQVRRRWLSRGAVRSAAGAPK